MKDSYKIVSESEKPPRTFMHSALDSIAELKNLLISPYIQAYGGLEKQTVVRPNGVVVKRYYPPDTDEVVCMFVHKNNNIHFYERNRPE